MPLRKLPNLHTIQFIRSLHITRQVNLLEGEGGFNVYLGNKYNRIAEFSKYGAFNNFMTKNKINMIVYSKNLYHDIRFRNDNEWLSFMHNYTHYGFDRMAIPNTDRLLYVEKNLLTINKSNHD